MLLGTHRFTGPASRPDLGPSCRRILGLFFILVLCFTRPVGAATTVDVGTAPSKTLIKGTFVTPDQVIDGEMVVDGDTITCVAVSCAAPDGATRITVTNAYIFPGFVDAHNHVAYNILARWTPPKLYQRRSQWQAAQAYKDFKKPYNDLITKGLFCEMVKYGEVKALLSGVTTIQGTAPNNLCFRTLIRNAENQNQLGLPGSHIRTFILDISSFKGSLDWAVTQSFAVHIAEGVRGDPPSKQEFAVLKSKGLLAKGTAIIHGAAFEASEFQQMGEVGAKLIWSPRSNLVLYGQTTNIPLARQAGVEVSLGVDWNPTGSDHIFDELRTAAEVNEDDFGGAIPDDEWMKMVTVNPAKALALEEQVGRLAPGLKADLTVLRSQGSDPTKSLLRAHLQDVQMVWVGGKLLYANRAILDKIRPGQCEALLVHGAPKRVCVKDMQPAVPKSAETLAQIREVLRANYPLLAPLTP
ncbi:MAG TPA: amidohydrolase family protein [Gemmatimonadales bacterium]|nr:amidohydrolase family protein [Gemmatimonadales bacterium]